MGPAKFLDVIIYLKLYKIRNRKIKLMDNLLCANCAITQISIGPKTPLCGTPPVAGKNLNVGHRIVRTGIHHLDS